MIFSSQFAEEGLPVAGHSYVMSHELIEYSPKHPMTGTSVDYFLSWWLEIKVNAGHRGFMGYWDLFCKVHL